MNFPLLTFLTLIPGLGGIYLLLSGSSPVTARRISLVVTALLACGVFRITISDSADGGFHFTENYEWLELIGFRYHLAVDGISLVFLFLTAAVFLMSFLASATFAHADRSYYGLLLLLQSGLVGTFTAQNFLHFFFFWELSLIPAFFLLKNYGGPQRSFAATQFFIYTMAGSIAMLLGFLALYLGTNTFEFAELAGLSRQSSIGELIKARMSWTGFTGTQVGVLAFLLAFAGVAVKVPLWPLHSWQPLAYTEAPTPVTMVLTGIMSKMGVYALIRIFPIFREEIHLLHQPLLALAVITILYGAIAACAQRDIKRLFAYSSLSHLGYCFLAIFAAGKNVPGLTAMDDRAAAVNGVLLQVLSHGILAASLFAFASFLETRNGTRLMERFGGLRAVHPHFAGLMGIALFASLGLPGLSGFPAEFLIFKGSFPSAPLATSLAALGLLLTTYYVLTFYGKVFHGPCHPIPVRGGDLTLQEKLVVLPAIAGAILLGIAPGLATQWFNASVVKLIQQMAN